MIRARDDRGPHGTRRLSRTGILLGLGLLSVTLGGCMIDNSAVLPISQTWTAGFKLEPMQHVRLTACEWRVLGVPIGGDGTLHEPIEQAAKAAGGDTVIVQWAQQTSMGILATKHCTIASGLVIKLLSWKPALRRAELQVPAEPTPQDPLPTPAPAAVESRPPRARP